MPVRYARRRIVCTPHLSTTSTAITTRDQAKHASEKSRYTASLLTQYLLYNLILYCDKESKASTKLPLPLSSFNCAFCRPYIPSHWCCALVRLKIGFGWQGYGLILCPIRANTELSTSTSADPDLQISRSLEASFQNDNTARIDLVLQDNL